MDSNSKRHDQCHEDRRRQQKHQTAQDGVSSPSPPKGQRKRTTSMCNSGLAGTDTKTAALSCPICYDRIDTPHTLKGCSHTACKGCLKEWFSTSEKNANVTMTCPVCRAVVDQDEAAVVMDKHEFDNAINYVMIVKKRFESEPATYQGFLDVLQAYNKGELGVIEILREVSVLFAGHPDLKQNFIYFIPDNFQDQAKDYLDSFTRESEV